MTLNKFLGFLLICLFTLPICLYATFPICTEPFSQEYPALVFDSANFLVVWLDERDGNPNIYGSRVTETGNVLDTSGIPICVNTSTQESPSIAFNGTNYLIAWVDCRSNDYAIYGARVDQEGIVLDPEGIPISDNGNYHSKPSITSDGQNFFLVWDENCWPSSIQGCRVDNTGTILDTLGIDISNENCGEGIHVSSNGTIFLVAWKTGGSNSDIHGARVNSSGVVLDSVSIQICVESHNQWYPKVASDGVNFLVVWEDHRVPDSDIYGARIDQNGLVLDSSAIPICTEIGAQYDPHVDFDGTNYIVIWHGVGSNGWGTYGTRISLDGTVLDSGGIFIPDVGGYDITFAYGSSHLLLVWAEGYYPYDIYGSIEDFASIEESTGYHKFHSSEIEVFPNPFMKSVKIEGCSGVKIYDISGRLVTEVKDEWNGRNTEGKEVKAGIYFLKLNGKPVGKAVKVR